MTEYDPYKENPDENEQLRQAGLSEAIDNYLEADDAEFVEGLEDEAERIGYVYGRLLELGQDPDSILFEFGVIGEPQDEV